MSNLDARSLIAYRNARESVSTYPSCDYPLDASLKLTIWSRYVGVHSPSRHSACGPDHACGPRRDVGVIEIGQVLIVDSRMPFVLPGAAASVTSLRKNRLKIAVALRSRSPPRRDGVRPVAGVASDVGRAGWGAVRLSSGGASFEGREPPIIFSTRALLFDPDGSHGRGEDD
jgi:hypothetical protein